MALRVAKPAVARDSASANLLSSAQAAGPFWSRNSVMSAAEPASAADAAVRTARRPDRYAQTTLPRSVSGSPDPSGTVGVPPEPLAAYAVRVPSMPVDNMLPAAIPVKMASA